jgi:hypothetical protein
MVEDSHQSPCVEEGSHSVSENRRITAKENREKNDRRKKD